MRTGAAATGVGVMKDSFDHPLTQGVSPLLRTPLLPLIRRENGNRGQVSHVQV